MPSLALPGLSPKVFRYTLGVPYASKVCEGFSIDDGPAGGVGIRRGCAA